MRILLTGGTGSFGKAFIKQILGSDFGVERLVVYSRDELKQWEMQQTYTHTRLDWGFRHSEPISFIFSTLASDSTPEKFPI